jgi:hypothetical protein
MGYRKQREFCAAGTKMHFVAQHLDKSAAEIVEAAKQAGIDIAATQAHTTRSILKKHGITKPILTDAGAKQLAAANGKPKPKSSTKRKSSAPRARPRSAAKKAKPVSNGHAPGETNAKTDALRRLIFELGFDVARGVFDEFKQIHERMRGQA